MAQSRRRHIPHLVFQLTLRELKGRYVGSVMGFFWNIVHPLITLAIWTFVFSYLLKLRFSPEGGLTDFAFYLFCGMVPFLSFQETIVNCTQSITANTGLVKNLVFPSKALQFSIGGAALVSQLLSLSILAVAVLVVRGHFPILFLLVVPFSLLLMLFGIGIGWLTCTLHVYFRDTAQLVGVGMMVWFYATPIFYPASIIPARLHFLTYLNPLAYAVSVYRFLILSGPAPPAAGMPVLLLCSLGAFWLGFRVYTRYYPGFIDEL